MDVSVKYTGPILNGLSHQYVQEFMREAVYEVGTQAKAEVHRVLDNKIKNPTPYYETQIILQQFADGVIVHDRGISYGPWLEGVSHRNQTTRFKGYHAFKKAKQLVDKNMQQIVGPALRKFMQKMGVS